MRVRIHESSPLSGTPVSLLSRCVSSLSAGGTCGPLRPSGYTHTVNDNASTRPGSTFPSSCWPDISNFLPGHWRAGGRLAARARATTLRPSPTISHRGHSVMMLFSSPLRPVLHGSLRYSDTLATRAAIPGTTSSPVRGKPRRTTRLLYAASSALEDA